MKKYFFLILLFLMLFLKTKANTIKFYIFYSNECELCNEILNNYLPEIEPYYNLEYKKFEIGDEKNLILLDRLEEKYNKTAEIPEFFIGEYLIGGEEVKEKLESILNRYSETGCDFPNVKEGTSSDSIKIYNGKIYLAYFFKTGCKHCDKTFYDLKVLKRKYPSLVIKEYNIKDKKAMELNEAMCEKYNIPPKKHLATPMVFIGDSCLIGDKARKDNMEKLIKNSKSHFPPWESINIDKNNISEIFKKRFKSFSIFTIAFAGLIDGINPCAFATIIFLISYLALLKRKGKEIILIGLIYTFSVFLTYFFVGILGLNILRLLQDIKIISIIVKFIFLGTGFLVLIFSILSFYDFYLIKKGNTSDIILQLPAKFKKKIHKHIREKSRMSNLAIGSFLIGFLVSIQELFCTGQVYLPTLVYMSNMPNYKTGAFLYLVLYNILFILPLVLVFIAFYKGITSEILQKIMKRNLSLSKILLGILFLILSVFLLGLGFSS